MTLTRRQKWRIEKVQSEKISRASNASIKAESSIEKGTEELQGLVITRYGQRQLVESNNGDLFQATGRQNIGLSVAGDRVLFQKVEGDEGVVTAIYPRKTELKRQDRLIAANIDQLWLVVAIEPHYQFELIDRYLIMAENSNLPINIIVNKIELSNNDNQLSNDFSQYIDLGYDVHFLSVKNKTNLEKLKKSLVTVSYTHLTLPTNREV